MAERKAVIVGISGASSSGKTTLARLLRDIFPSTFILHEDDFYKAESEYVLSYAFILFFTLYYSPTRDGLLDWDCAAAIDIPGMAKALAYIRQHATFPVSLIQAQKHTSRTDHGTKPFVDSKEDKNSVGQCPVSDAKREEMRKKVEAWLQPGQPGHEVLMQSQQQDGDGGGGLKICLLDGFLLYSREMQEVMDQLDVKMFLLVSKAKATQRREARDGYIVWPNYAEAHAWLFEKGDVEAKLDGAVLKEKNILAQQGRGLDVDMDTTFEWTVDTLLEQLGRFAKGN
ncbi:P-loop containing nucleoside triphosphate hydrolase protein [Apiospora rasikravindrae]|uniref:P-loop containing nucleoside triphosphate hydrolase protein n=1 Tax=Apiospora rasikravindrae TaxID=990691 RepID=A0ABR1SZK2_9PEZI